MGANNKFRAIVSLAVLSQLLPMMNLFKQTYLIIVSILRALGCIACFDRVYAFLEHQIKLTQCIFVLCIGGSLTSTEV